MSQENDHPYPPNNLRRMRTDIGWTQQEVGDAVFLTKSMVSLHENRRREVSPQHADAYARFYVVPERRIFSQVNRKQAETE